MVSYREDADRPRKRREPEGIAARRAARNAARTEDDWRSYARDTVYKQLGMMERSVDQLRKTLAAREVPEEIAEETLAAFQEAGLIDDARFADVLARTRFNGKAISRRSIREELVRKGVDREIADAALEQFDEEDEARSAREFAVSKVRSMGGLEREVVRRRLYGALSRRGFGPGISIGAINAALAAWDGDDDGELD